MALNHPPLIFELPELPSGPYDAINRAKQNFQFALFQEALRQEMSQQDRDPKDFTALVPLSENKWQFGEHKIRKTDFAYVLDEKYVFPVEVIKQLAFLTTEY